MPQPSDTQALSPGIYRVVFLHLAWADKVPSMVHSPDPELTPRFQLEKAYATSAVTQLTEKCSIDMSSYLRRHQFGD